MISMQRAIVNWVSESSDETYVCTIEELVDYGVPADEERGHPMIAESVVVDDGVPVNVDEVIVHYDNGSHQSLDVMITLGIYYDHGILGVTVEEY